MNEIDNRVVSMEFDNQRFEKNVQTSLGTIQRLNGVLDNLDKIDFSGLESAIQGISNRVSNAGIAVASFISNITNRVVDSALEMTKSLTIGNISSGFANYETELKSVQNVMNATGESMENVAIQTDRLRFYSDETSYSYADLIQTFSSFTSQGLGIQESADAVMGIANILGLVGVEASNAGHAFTGFAKAMSGGHMSSQTWQWLHTVNADTAQTEQIMLDAAVAVGTLEKTAEGFYKTTSKTEKAGQQVNLGNFESTLHYDWLNTDVMEYAFADMSAYSNLLDNFINQYKALYGESLTANEAMDLLDNHDPNKIFDSQTIQAYASAMRSLTGTGMTTEEALEALQNREETLSEKGYRAGQAYRTFADTIGATKTAISTAFAGMFKSIFGNTEQAKETWSAVGGWMYDIFAAPFVDFDDVLSEWATGSGRDTFMEGFYTMGDSVLSVIEAIREGFSRVFPPITIEQLDNLSTKFNELAKSLEPGEEGLEKIGVISENIAKIFSSLIQNVKKIGSSIRTAFRNIIPEASLDSINGFVESVVVLVENFSISEQATEKLTSAFEGMFAVIDIIREAFKAAFRIIGENVDVFKKLGSSVLTGASNFGKFLTAIRDTIVQNDSFYNGMKKVIDFVKPGFEKIAEAASNTVEMIAEFLGFDFTVPQSLENFSETVSTALENIKKKLSPVSAIFGILYRTAQKLFDYLFNSLEKLENVLNNLSKWFKSLKETIVANFQEIKKQFTEAFGEDSTIKIQKVIALIIGILSGNIAWESTWLFKGINAIKDFFTQDFGGKLRDLVGNIKTAIEDLGGALEGIEEIFTKTKDGVLVFLESFQNTEMTKQIRNMAVSLLILASAMWIMASINGDDIGKALVILGASLLGLVGVTKLAIGLLKGLKIGLKGSAEIGAIAVVFIALAGACLLLAISMRILASVPFMDLLGSAGAMVAILLSFVGVVALLKPMTSTLIVSAGAILMLSFAVINIAAALLVLSAIPIDNLETILISLAGTFLIMAAALVGIGIAMNYFAMGAGTILAASAALVVASVGILILAAALGVLALIPAESLAAGLNAFIEVAVVLTLALVLLASIGPMVLAAGAALLLGGAGILVISQALIILAGAITLLSMFKPETILALSGTLLALAVGLAVLAAAGVVCLVGGPGLIMAGNALVDIATALLLMKGTYVAGQGMGFIPLAIGLLALSVAGVALLVGGSGLIMGGKALVNLGTGLALMKGTLMAAQGMGFIPLAIGLLALSVAGVALLVGGLGLMLGGKALTTLAGSLIILSTVDLNMVSTFLPILADGLAAMAIAGVGLIVGSVGLLLAGSALLLLSAGFSASKSALTGIEKIDLTEACKHLNNLADTLKDYKNLGKNFKNESKDIQDGIRNVVTESFRLTDVSMFESVGNAISEYIGDGIENKSYEIEKAAKEVVTNSVSAANSIGNQWQIIGQNIDKGIASGIYTMAHHVRLAVMELALSLPQQFSAVLQIRSPSRVFEKLTEYIPAGAALGIQNGSRVAIGAMTQLGDSLVSSAHNAVDRMVYAMQIKEISPINPIAFANDIDNLFDDDFFNPEITPRMNLSVVSQEIAAMQDLMNTISGNAITVRSKTNNPSKGSNTETSKTNTENSNTTNITNHIHIDGARDPHEVAEEVSRIIQSQVDRKKAQWA